MAKKKRRRDREERGGRVRRKKGSKSGRSGSGFKYKKRGADKWKARAEQSGYNRRSIFADGVTVFRPKDGDNLIRILPPTWEDAEHYGYEIWCHYGIGPDGDTFLDRQKMLGEPDPIEEERARALNDNDKEYADKLNSKKRVCVYVIDRDEEDKGVQLWSMPWSMDADITTLAVDKRTGEVLDIDDPENGYDVEFTKTGKGIKTQYGGIAIARKSTPLDNDAALEQAVELPIPDALIFHEYDDIAKTFGAGNSAYDDEEDEDEDDDEEDRPKKKGKGKSKRRRDEEDEEDEDEEASKPTWQQVQDMDVDDLFDVIDDHNLDVEDDIDEDDEEEVEDLRAAICKELGLSKPGKRKPKKAERDKLRKKRRRR